MRIASMTMLGVSAKHNMVLVGIGVLLAPTPQSTFRWRQLRLRPHSNRAQLHVARHQRRFLLCWLRFTKDLKFNGATFVLPLTDARPGRKERYDSMK
jgi:hypothetical protein